MSHQSSRLAAVLFADIVGYSDLAARDEALALRLLRSFQAASRAAIPRFGGRVVKFLGDGVLAEFSSTRAAIGAAVSLGEELARRAGEGALGEPALRTGIHVGDVTASEGDIFGDGVNTAARLHAVAEPGEILVTGDVFRQLKQRREIEFEPRGERELKGVGQVEIYAASPTRAIEPETGEGEAARISPRRAVQAAVAIGLVAVALAGGWYLVGGGPEVTDRSIAVLPFETIGEGADPTFTEGMHGDVLTRLSGVSGLDVISRTSVMRYRHAEKSPPEIAEELGVAWVLQGEVQQIGDRVRVNARLVDARRDRQVWAEDYLHELTAVNVFEIQREITLQIVGALETQLTREEAAAIASAPTEDLEAYRLFVHGRGLLDQRTEAAIRRAMEHFERAIEQDPNYALAWVGLADALALMDFYGYPARAGAVDPIQAARRAVELDPQLGEAHASLGIHLSLRQRGPEALAALERAVELKPGYSEAVIWLSWVQLVLGRPTESLDSARRAAELNPLAPAVRVYLAEALLANGESRSALHETRRAIELQPDYGLPHYVAGLALLHLDRPAEARAAFEQTLPLVPPEGAPTHAEIQAALAVGHAASGDTARAREILDRIDALSHPFSAGLIHAALGEEDEAFASFARVRDWSTFTEHARYFYPDVLASLREDPRHRELVRAINRAWGLEPDGSLPPS